MDFPTVDERTYGDNVTIRVVYDDDPADSPRDWCNITTIRGWHRNYEIGDGPNINADDYESWDDMIRTLIDEDGPLVLMAPLFWYEHSGVTCSMGPVMRMDDRRNDGPDEYAAELAAFRSQCMDDSGWDSGTAGLVYVTEKSLAEAGTDPADAEEVARSEVDTYAAWLRGEVYGYVVDLVTTCDHGDEHADTLNSCWGFVGEPEYAMDEGRGFVGWHVIGALMRLIGGWVTD